MVQIEVREELAAVVEQRAEALGTSPSQWLSLMITDVVADIPDGGFSPDEWIGR